MGFRCCFFDLPDFIAREAFKTTLMFCTCLLYLVRSLYKRFDVNWASKAKQRHANPYPYYMLVLLTPQVGRVPPCSVNCLRIYPPLLGHTSKLVFRQGSKVCIRIRSWPSRTLPMQNHQHIQGLDALNANAMEDVPHPDAANNQQKHTQTLCCLPEQSWVLLACPCLAL